MKSILIWALGVAVLSPQGSFGAQEAAVPASEKARLADLLAEAERNNPEIQAAKQGWQSQQKMPSQAATLPDPQVVLQQVNVGSPRPFAGFTNSDFSYIGIGVSQDLPYPGKLRLRGELAKRETEIAEQKVEAVRRAARLELRVLYSRIAYLAKQGEILEGDRQLLRQMEKAAEIRYRSGAGNQQEVLQAQLEETKLLREAAANQLEAGQNQAKIKRVLGRGQAAPDVAPEEIRETSAGRSYEELLSAAQTYNPQILGARKSVEKQGVAIEIAKKDFYPDFNAQFMWQRTDPAQYRAYYQFTVGARIPVHRKSKQQPELEQAKIEKNRAESELEAQSQEVSSEIRQLSVAAEKSSELLNIYRDGLLPQARAELQAGLAAYQSNRTDFQALLTSFLDVLRIEEAYWQTLAEHETALAQIEEMTGASPR